MAALKSADVERYLSRPDPQKRIVLLYGPDAGLVIERANALCKATGVDLSDAFSTIRIDADEAAQDRGRLAGEAGTVGMFGGDRLIRVSGTTRRNLAEAIKLLIEQPPSDAWVIIEAGELDNRSALRKMVETADCAIALPCYQDNDAALARLIGEEITDHGLSLDRDAAAYLRSHLGSDRMASRNELRKLALYCEGQGSVTVDDINAVVSDASAFSADDVIDAAGRGDITGLEENFGRVLEEGLSADMLLVFALRHFQLLHEVRSTMEARGQAVQAAIAAMRPQPHFSRRDSFTRTLSAFSADSMRQQLQRLETAAFEARRNPALAASIAGTALLAVALTARRGLRN